MNDQLPPTELSDGWNRWRGGVDTTLKNVDIRLGGVETKVDAMPDEIEERLERVINGPQAAERCPFLAAQASNPVEASHDSGQAVTFKWLAEKAFLPILLGIAMAVIGFMLAN